MIPLRVEHITEEYGYIAQQRCVCGGRFEVGLREYQNEGRKIHEVFHGRCVACGSERAFVFDITDVMEGYGSGGDGIGATWPVPSEGPYAIRRTDHGKRTAQLKEAWHRGELSIEVVESLKRGIVETTFPLINGRYRVFGYRKGSMGITHFCIDEQALESDGPRVVVCKCLGRSQDGSVVIDEITSECMRKEAEIWLELGHHPNVVELLELVYRSPGNLVLVLEAVMPGPRGKISLRDWIKKGDVTWPLPLRFAQDLCRGMLHCHRRVPGFVHGDLKPENLLIDVAVGYSLKITDFGLSRGAVSAELDSAEKIGTPMYRAPECWEGQPRAPASDVYAVGLILYEMVAGHHALSEADEIADVREAHLHGINLASVRIPEAAELLQIAQRCVARQPSERPSIEEVADCLGAAKEDAASPEDAQDQALEWNNKGTALAALGRHQEAIVCYSNALCQRPDSAIGWLNLAISLSNCRRTEEAERAYRRCFASGDVPPSASASYGAHLVRLGGRNNLRRAVEFCDKTLESTPDMLVALLNKATALNGLGEYSDAAQAAERARLLDPSHPHVLFELATAYSKLRRHSKALKCVNKALELDPQFEPAKRLKRQLRG